MRDALRDLADLGIPTLAIEGLPVGAAACAAGVMYHPDATDDELRRASIAYTRCYRRSRRVGTPPQGISLQK